MMNLKILNRRHLNSVKFYLLLFIVLSQSLLAQQREKENSDNELKPRLVVLTDVSTWETDDSESLVRLLVHADLFEIEGLVFTTGWSWDAIDVDAIHLIHDAIDAYEKDLPNLLKRSGQKQFAADESKQHIGYWPSPEYLRERTMIGSIHRGIEFIGEDNDSPGSNLIITQADEEDERPLWITVWGGGNTVAQSIWRVKHERSETELKAFLRKIPVYTITDQDRKYDGSEGFEISSHQWMRSEFSEDLVFLWDECAWKYQNGTGRSNWEEYAAHIQNHGNLGKMYPKYKYGVEGDTPAFLHILPNGLNYPTAPRQAGWGGYFEWGMSPDNETWCFTNHKAPAYDISYTYQEYFYPAIFNNFAARMDWANEGRGNRNPVVAVNGDQGIDILEIHCKTGKAVKLDASKSFDPDGDELTFKWWVLPESATYEGDVSIAGESTRKATIVIPEDSSGKTIHVICEISDNGDPELISYRRIIIESTK
jgi:hypothetical protein